MPESNSHSTARVAAIMPAAGSGTRFGGEHNKLFAMILGQPIWWRSFQQLASTPQISTVVIPINESDRPIFERDLESRQDILGISNCDIQLVRGGSERNESVVCGLNAIPDSDAFDLIAIHDAARPLVCPQDIESVINEASTSGAAILATPITGTVKRESQDRCETIDRRELWVAQTPQVFQVDLIRRAHARHRGRAATDDAQLVERMGHPVSLVRGRTDNLKITHPEDIFVAEAILAQKSQT